MASVVEQSDWDSRYSDEELAYDPKQVPFRELLDRYLQPPGTCFEAGCYPGRFLAYLGKRFGYTVSGIDATPYVSTRLRDHLVRNGVAVGKLYHGDFLEFETTEQYDVVCSFGFVEHFLNFEEVIERHIVLVRPGGTLILSCPNFRGVQYLLHRLIEPDNLRRHVLAAMSLKRWDKVLQRHGMQVAHQGYYRTAGFWTAAPRSAFWVTPAVKFIDLVTTQVDRRIHRPNPWLSPYMISISRKAQGDAE